MAHSPRIFDKGTRFTNYSSIHSVDAFVGDYQVMYTPGSTTPQFNKAAKKPSRFSRATSASLPQQANQSFLLPSNMPNTSQIMPEHGALPNIQVHYNIPADEKQIVASLRSLQQDLADAMATIHEITRERDEALHELRLVRATSRKPSSPHKKQSMASRVEEELFDISRSGEALDPAPRQSSGRRVALDKQVTTSDNARVLSPILNNVSSTRHMDKRLSSKIVGEEHKQPKKPVTQDMDLGAAVEEHTAASNTSRRRRRPSIEENMTSAYILPDITEQGDAIEPRVSQEARNILHSLEPEHIANCDVCRRLTANDKLRSKNKPSAPKQIPTIRQPPAKIDYTAQVAGFSVDESFAQDATMRPKIAPVQALTRVRALMAQQFLRAKERHHEAWVKYDSIEAPMSSRRHAQISKEMSHWAEKMEECRIHLDYLRDVEEGMDEDA